MKQTNEKRYERIAGKALKVIQAHPALAVKLLLECWNAEAPHFGGGDGGMPHRYDGNLKRCAYCLRPKRWKQANPGFIAGHTPGDEP